jgi:hypothetical protein
MSLLVRFAVPVVSLAMGALLVALPGGCNRKTMLPATTVRGVVTFQGKPLAGGLVVFSPDPDRGGSGKSLRGKIGADGRYELKANEDRVIAPGWYRVAIAAPASALLSPGSEPAAIPTFPAKLARPDLSGLVREIKPSQENVFEFAVEVPQG